MPYQKMRKTSFYNSYPSFQTSNIDEVASQINNSLELIQTAQISHHQKQQEENIFPIQSQQDLETKYIQRQDKLIFYSVITILFIDWNLFHILTSLPTEFSTLDNVKFLSGISIDCLVSIIFTYDTFLKIQFSINQQKNISYPREYILIDIISGPVALIFDILFFLQFRRMSYISMILRVSQGFTLIYTRHVISNLSRIFPFVGDLLLSLLVIFYFFTYIATYLYSDYFQDQMFGNVFNSFITMLQIMTLDGWGDIGRDILKRDSLVAACFLFLFIFVMSYFLLNVLIGKMLELLSQRRKQNLIIEPNSSPSSKHFDQRNKLNSTQKNSQIGRFLQLYITHVVIFLWFILIFDTAMKQQIRCISEISSKIVNLVIPGLFTYHMFLLLFSEEIYFIKEKGNGKMMLFHALSGPIALGLNIYDMIQHGCINEGGMLVLLKLFTLPAVRGIIIGIIEIIPLMGGPFVMILSLIFIFAVFFVNQFGDMSKKYWGDFNNAILSFFQILTLDNWCAGILKIAIQKQHYEILVIFTIFIFVANYFLLNIMIAISSDQFVQHDVDCEEKNQIDYYERPFQKKLQFAQNIQTEEVVEDIIFLANFYDYKNIESKMMDLERDLKDDNRGFRFQKIDDSMHIQLQESKEYGNEQNNEKCKRGELYVRQYLEDKLKEGNAFSIELQFEGDKLKINYEEFEKIAEFVNINNKQNIIKQNIEQMLTLIV